MLSIMIEKIQKIPKDLEIIQFDELIEKLR
jgi:hypothetical protein